jgi:hypothetical protein
MRLQRIALVLVGEAFSLDSAVAAKAAMAKSAFRGLKAAPTRKRSHFIGNSMFFKEMALFI